MSIKFILLKSGEGLISDIHEMVVGNEDESKVVGYYLIKPCIVSMGNSNQLSSESDNIKKAGFKVSLFPWMPLSKDDKIPIPADWLVTMTEPVDKLKEMYVRDVIEYGKEISENISTDE
jgi:hypothetical protein